MCVHASFQPSRKKKNLVFSFHAGFQISKGVDGTNVGIVSGPPVDINEKTKLRDYSASHRSGTCFRLGAPTLMERGD